MLRNSFPGFCQQKRPTSLKHPSWSELNCADRKEGKKQKEFLSKKMQIMQISTAASRVKVGSIKMDYFVKLYLLLALLTRQNDCKLTAIRSKVARRSQAQQKVPQEKFSKQHDRREKSKAFTRNQEEEELQRSFANCLRRTAVKINLRLQSGHSKFLHIGKRQ